MIIETTACHDKKGTDIKCTLFILSQKVGVYKGTNEMVHELKREKLSWRIHNAIRDQKRVPVIAWPADDDSLAEGIACCRRRTNVASSLAAPPRSAK